MMNFIQTVVPTINTRGLRGKGKALAAVVKATHVALATPPVADEVTIVSPTYCPGMGASVVDAGYVDPKPYTTTTHAGIPNVWLVGNRNPLVMSEGNVHYVILRWSAKLALVLDHQFSSFTAANATVEKIIAARTIDVTRWLRYFSNNYSQQEFNLLFPYAAK